MFATLHCVLRLHFCFRADYREDIGAGVPRGTFRAPTARASQHLAKDRLAGEKNLRDGEIS